MTPTKIYVASAGTGKTTAIMNELESVLAHTPPERIIYTSFTNAAADEAVERACARFPYTTDQFVHFRTLHSLCYRNIPKFPMLTYRDYKQFGSSIKMAISGFSAMAQDGIIRMQATRGDILLALDSLKRVTYQSYEDVCRTQVTSRETPAVLKHFSESLQLFKESIGKIDFCDQLEMFLKQDIPLDVDYLFVDEAQDFSPLQWDIVRLLARNVKQLVIAGDDKQSIFSFAGASPQSLIEFQGDRVLLGETYRLPENILKEAHRISDRIVQKTPFTVTTSKTGGTVSRTNSIKDLPLDEGSWFFLVRNRCYAEYIESQLMEAGVLFQPCSADSRMPTNLLPTIHTWKHLLAGGFATAKQIRPLYEQYLPTKTRIKFGFKKRFDNLKDDELLTITDLFDNYGLLTKLPWDKAFHLPERLCSYLLSIENKGQLLESPRIEVNTIHGVKGKEADHVAILPDIAYPTQQTLRSNPDSEHRCFYVAVTRAKKTLWYLSSITENYYPL